MNGEYGILRRRFAALYVSETSMNAALGVGLLATSAIMFAWLYGQNRRPNPARWTKSEALSTIVSMLVLGLFAFGLAYVGRFVVEFGSETHWVADALAIVVAVSLAVVLVPRLMKPARIIRVGPTAVTGPVDPDSIAHPANDPGPSGASSGRPDGRPTKGRAA